MQISVSSWSFHNEFDAGRLDMVGFIKEARNTLHLDAIELVNWMAGGNSRERLQKLKNALLENRIKVVNVPIDTGNISEIDPIKREKDLAGIKEWMDAAAFLGSSFVRVNSGSQPAGKEDLAITVRSYRELADYARDKHMTLTLENHGGLSANPDYMLRVYKEVAHPNFRLCPDFGNFSKDIRYNALERVFDFASLAHVKSYSFHEDGSLAEYDLEKCIHIAKQHRYNGYLSIEFEGSADPYEGVMKTARAIQKLI